MEIQRIYSEIDTGEKLYSVLLSESEMEKIFARISFNPKFGKEWGQKIWEDYKINVLPKYSEKAKTAVKGFSKRLFSIKYNPTTKKYEGKVDWKDRVKGAAFLGTTGAGVGALLGGTIGKPRKGALIGAGIGTGLSSYFMRKSRFDKHNRKIDEALNNYKKDRFERLSKNLPISYSEFSKKFPNQAKQLKYLKDYGLYSDENPGNIEWFELGGLEKGRYLPITAKDDYNNLMFDTKTGKYVTLDSEELEPYPVKDIKSWARDGLY